MIRGILYVVLSLVTATMLIACTEQTDFTTTDYHSVVRIFMHEKNHYTFYIQEPAKKEVQILSFMTVYSSLPKIFTDVPAGELSWIRVGAPFENSRYRWSLDIHIHSVSEINGGGWNHGKFGSGQTTVLE